MKYGERLRFSRKARGYSQQELVKLSGVGQGSISKIERGDQEASTFDVELAMALKINPLWLSRGIGDMEYTGNPIIFPSSIPVIDADTWQELSPSIRVFIEDFAIKANKHIVNDDTVRVLQGMIDIMTNKHIASGIHQ
jgi:transcriptional regulator with XRE-family HTH domain